MFVASILLSHGNMYVMFISLTPVTTFEISKPKQKSVVMFVLTCLKNSSYELNVWNLRPWFPTAKDNKFRANLKASVNTSFSKISTHR